MLAIFTSTKVFKLIDEKENHVSCNCVQQRVCLIVLMLLAGGPADPLDLRTEAGRDKLSSVKPSYVTDTSGSILGGHILRPPLKPAELPAARCVKIDGVYCQAKDEGGTGSRADDTGEDFFAKSMKDGSTQEESNPRASRTEASFYSSMFTLPMIQRPKSEFTDKYMTVMK